MFVELCGVAKGQSSVDYAMLEYCIREDLKMKRSRMMAVLDPIKLIIDNYPEGEVEYLSARILWKSRRRNISVSSRAMKSV